MNFNPIFTYRGVSLTPPSIHLRLLPKRIAKNFFYRLKINAPYLPFFIETACCLKSFFIDFFAVNFLQTISFAWSARWISFKDAPLFLGNVLKTIAMRAFSLRPRREFFLTIFQKAVQF